jgi:hypothetical protein
MSVSKLSQITSLAPSTVRYWLKKHGLKTIQSQRNDTATEHFCSACNQTKSITLFYKRKRGGYMGWCIECAIASSRGRLRENKQRAVDAHGGACVTCGYSKYIGALEFHHPDPSKKDPSYAKMKAAHWDKYWAEVSKCVLLCANCHREVHALPY